jgi:hypothetical protein
MGSRPSRHLLHSPNSVRDASGRADDRDSSGRSNGHHGHPSDHGRDRRGHDARRGDDRHDARRGDLRGGRHAHDPLMRQPENTPPRQAPQRLLDRSKFVSSDAPRQHDKKRRRVLLHSRKLPDERCATTSLNVRTLPAGGKFVSERERATKRLVAQGVRGRLAGTGVCGAASNYSTRGGN